MMAWVVACMVICIGYDGSTRVRGLACEIWHESNERRDERRDERMRLKKQRYPTVV